jgi:PAS domain-containing protein
MGSNLLEACNRVALTDRAIAIAFPDKEAAWELLDRHYYELAGSAKALGKYETRIYMGDDPIPRRILASMSRSQGLAPRIISDRQSQQGVSDSMPRIGTLVIPDRALDIASQIVIPEAELTLAQAHLSDDAYWIIGQDEKVLYANPAALAANANPPEEEIMNSPFFVFAVWQQENLQKLREQLAQDKKLVEHDNIGYRFQANPEYSESNPRVPSRIPVRHHFWVNYWEIEFFNQPARLEWVQRAEKLENVA